MLFNIFFSPGPFLSHEESHLYEDWTDGRWLLGIITFIAAHYVKSIIT